MAFQGFTVLSEITNIMDSLKAQNSWVLGSSSWEFNYGIILAVVSQISANHPERHQFRDRMHCSREILRQIVLFGWIMYNRKCVMDKVYWAMK